MACVVRIVCVLGAFILIVSAPFLSPFANGFKTIDVPFSGALATVANGINAQGDIVGQYRTRKPRA